MSSTASNYDVASLYVGIGMAAVAFLSTVGATFGYFSGAGSVGIWTAMVAVLHGVMMFASSFVEEEQHFWYWVASGWFAWLLLKKYGQDSTSKSGSH